MTQLVLHLFGSTTILLDGVTLTVEQRKVRALLAYLAFTARAHSRSALGALLWPEHTPTSASANLRQALWLLRSLGLAEWLTTDRHTVALRQGYWVDTAAFEAALRNGQYAEAIACYRDDLLLDLALPDAPQFMAWLHSERARLRQSFLAAFPPLIAQCRASGDIAQAHAYAQRWAALDSQHQHGRQHLTEIDQQLVAAATRSALPADQDDQETVRGLESPATLPESASPFVGRVRERTELRELLNTGRRLVTLVGPGGIGKTRLAVELAESLRPEYPDGVAFVPLQAVAQSEHVPSAIAEVLGLALRDRAASWQQVGEALRLRMLLLVLDNIEHLSGATLPLVSLLQRAPHLRILVTSREPLRLREEWLYPLEGLTLPTEHADPQTGESSAVQLFLSRVRQVRHNSDLNDQVADIARICRFVAGMPLAIELAATWTATLSCAEIADEIARDLAFLDTDLRDLPERHRSIRVVFDQAWERLSDPERNALMQLAVFRSGFTRELATGEQLAPVALLRLVERGLLRREATGRYRFHELLRQYALQRLGEQPAAMQAAYTACGQAITRFLGVQFNRLVGGEQRDAIAAITAERENITDAWPMMVTQAPGEPLRRAAQMLANYYFFCGPYSEGVRSLNLALEQLPPTGEHHEARLLRAAILVDLGYFHIRTGAISAAQASFAESEQIYTALATTPPPGISTDPLFGMGLHALVRGDYHAANQYAIASRTRSERHQLLGNLPYAWYLLTEAALAQGLYPAALRTARQSLIAARAAGDEWFSAYILAQLGQIALTLGHLDEAAEHLQAGYDIRAAFDDQQGMALALLALGTIARRRGSPDAAAALCTRAHAIYARIGDRGGSAEALDGLGALACAQGEYEQARQHLADALELATSIDYRHVMLSALTHLAELRLSLGQPEAAACVLAPVLQHPSLHRETSDLAQQLLARAETLLGESQIQAILQQHQPGDLEALIERELARLMLPLTPGTTPHPPPTAAAHTPHTDLVEPLSERELEILRLIADGHSNQSIADQLFLSVGTIKWYTGQIYGKLSVQTRTQAIARARRIQLL